jgi:copper/silver efflux system protein
VLITVSFLPVFTLAGQAGRLFTPLAYTKTFAMFAAAILSITLAPPLMVLLLKGRFRTEETNPVSRVIGTLYRPIALLAVRCRVAVVIFAVVLMIATVSVFQRLGSEFMPPLDEGSLLVMPTTFAGISSDAEAAPDDHAVPGGRVGPRQGRQSRDRDGPRAAGHDRVRYHAATTCPVAGTPRTSLVQRPRARMDQTSLRILWPDQRARTLAELSRDLDAALRMPGYQMAISPPIRTRIDMLTTGVRTPVGVKVFGDNLDEIEHVSIALEGMLREVPGTRSTFAERQTGREYVDIVPKRDAIARYGLTVRDVQGRCRDGSRRDERLDRDRGPCAFLDQLAVRRRSAL